MRSLATLRRALAHPPMRRLQLASAAWSAGEAAYLVGLFVYTYAATGAGGVALIAAIRTLPSVVLAPAMAALASQGAEDRALRATLVARIVSVALLGLLMATGGSAMIAFGLVAADSVAATFLRPLRGTLLPAVARSPDELVAGNVALTTGDSLANLVGPGLAAVALALAGPATTFAIGLALLALAFTAALGIRPDRRPRWPHGRRPMAHRDERLDAVRWLAGHPVRMVVAAFTVQRLVRGAMTVLVVAAAIDLLGMGDPGVGLLTAAMGIGGLVGGAVSVSLVGRRRLAPWFGLGIVVWGLGIAAVGVVPLAGVALVALATGGIGKVALDVAGYSLVQRSVPNRMRTRILGLQEGLVTAALAAGALLASWLVATVGVAGAMVLAGAVSAIAVVILWPWLRRVDAAVVVPDADLRLLHADPLFEPLPMATIEELAGGLDRRSVPAGAAIVHQGHPGDHYFIIEAGRVSVEIDRRRVGELGPGDRFGEIALLRNVPRTATITAMSDVRLATIERSRFLDAVTGNRLSSATAGQIVADRLGPKPA